MLGLNESCKRPPTFEQSQHPPTLLGLFARPSDDLDLVAPKEPLDGSHDQGRQKGRNGSCYDEFSHDTLLHLKNKRGVFRRRRYCRSKSLQLSTLMYDQHPDILVFH